MRSLHLVRAEKSADRGESPAQALRTLPAWVAGGSYYGTRADRRRLAESVLEALRERQCLERRRREDPRVGDRLDGRVITADTALRDAATSALTDGLAQRAVGGIYRLSVVELATYRALLELGARHPDGVGVCEDCRLVFRPSRKGRACKCNRCHSSPRPATPLPGEVGWTPYRAAVAREVVGAHCEPVGWHAVTVAWCEACGARMEGRGNARTCKPACRSWASRHRSDDGRVRRKRDSKAQRKVHRYVVAAPTPPNFSASLTRRCDRLFTVNYRYVEPAPTPQDFTISLHRGCNDLVIVNVVAGVLETHDAEVAKHLDARHDLRRG